MRDWQGKTYWLIGASEGLGRALAQQMSRAGARLVLTARSHDRLAQLAAELPGQSTILPADVTDSASFAAAAAKVGPVDGMVYLAGLLVPMDGASWDGAGAEAMVETNLTGALRALDAVLPGMVARGQGHIVLTGSLAGYRGLPGMGVYGATKAAVINLVESLNADLRDSGVEVQVMNPGYIRTRMTAQFNRALPMELEPEAAARVFFEGMNDDAIRRGFPFGLAAGARLGQFLPDWLYYRTIARKR